MRVTGLLGLGLLCAVAGAAVALAIGSGTGLLEETNVVVSTVERTGPAAAPLAPSGQREFDAAAIYAARAGGVVTIYAEFSGGSGSQGSGFVIDDDGTILSNAHVITDVASSQRAVRAADALYVEFSDGDRVEAQVVGWDIFSDVGVIRVDPADHPLAPVPLGDSATVAVGTPVAAIGSPFGNQGSLSVGVVSATGRQIDSLTSRYSVAGAIQIDAPINRGNSGGPLFDGSGRVIGINAQIRSSSGTAEGVGFAIPINLARRVLPDLEQTGKVEYAYIGIETQDVTPGIARRLGLPVERGALVARVNPGGPADKAGLRGGSERIRYHGLDLTPGGDVIVSIDGLRVQSADDISRIVTETLRPGQTVTFVVVRDGARRSIDVTLVARPVDPS
jgi:S1-C subfamily serine protease